MKITYLLFTLILITSCLTEEKRIEITLQECYYSSLEDKGEYLKYCMNRYENYLVRNNILKNKNGTSYIKSMLNISDIKVDSAFSDIYDDQLFKLDTDVQGICQILLLDSEQYKKSKLYKIKQIIKSNPPKDDFKSLGLEILDANDFELDYYKLSFFKALKPPYKQTDPDELQAVLKYFNSIEK